VEQALLNKVYESVKWCKVAISRANMQMQISRPPSKASAISQRRKKIAAAKRKKEKKA
jgi:hypothetical protein